MNPQIFLRGWMSEKLCWKATLCKYLHLKIIKWFLTNQRDVALIVISRVLLIMWFDEIIFKQYIILNFKAYIVVFCLLSCSDVIWRDFAVVWFKFKFPGGNESNVLKEGILKTFFSIIYFIKFCFENKTMFYHF